jgi:addiction module RelE/StbE family toxin
MKIIVTKAFAKQFNKLPDKIQKKFEERLEIFIKDQFSPILNTHSLIGEYKGFWSFNINSDDRVIFEQLPKNEVKLYAVGTHSKLYK